MVTSKREVKAKEEVVEVWAQLEKRLVLLHTNESEIKAQTTKEEGHRRASAVVPSPGQGE